jgi:hypothetical protein
MKSFNIANPPCGIYRGDLPLGYAYFHTLLDIYSRFLGDFKKLKISCPKYSLNSLGKRAESLNLDGTIEDLDKYTKNYIKQGKLRDNMNLSFSGNLLDTSSESVEQTLKVFRKLYEKGYSFRDGNTFYLDSEKIRRNFDLEEITHSINFFSNRGKKEFLRIISNSEDPIRITKERKYSIKNPFGGEGIAPIFGVANLWEGNFNGGLDLMASSEKELTRYISLRFFSQIPISDELPTKNILIYNHICPQNGFNSWDMEELTKNGTNSDSLRYAFAKSFSLSRQKMKLQNNSFDRGKRLVYLVKNLQKLFLNEQLNFKEFVNVHNPDYIKKMKNFKYSLVLEDLERKFRDISNKINISKHEGNFNMKKHEIFEEYLGKVKELSPFCPFTSKKIIKNELKK